MEWPVPIADVVEGVLTRVVGRVVALEPLLAPLSRRPCVFHTSLVEELFALPSNRLDRRTISEEVRVRFALHDSTGRAIIDPTHAHVLIERTREVPSDEAALGALVARSGVAARGWRRVGMIGHERTIAVGDPISVIGIPVCEPDPDGGGRFTGYRDAPTCARFAGTAATPLIIQRATEEPS